MTVVVPCAKCGASFQAGNGRFCPTCRGGFNPGELRIPSIAGAVPINNAARRARGLPEDPNEPKGKGYEDYLFRQAMLADGAPGTSDAEIEAHAKRRMKELFG